MPKKSSRSSGSKRVAAQPDLSHHLHGLGRRIGQAAVGNRPGVVVLRLRGAENREYRFECGQEGAVARGSDAGVRLLEVTADSERVRSILERKKNARAEFLAGGIRVRGDVQFAIELAQELGFIKERF